MIHLEKDQEVPENEHLRVAAETGDYAESAILPCYDATNSAAPHCSFQAQFIAYGGLVYRFNDAKDLGAAILQIDPNSTHIAASYVRMNNELLAQLNEGSLQPGSLNQVVSDEQANVQDQLQAQDPASNSSATSTDPVADQGGSNSSATSTPATDATTISDQQEATSTPSTTDQSSNATSTPDVVDQSGETTATSTPPDGTSSDSVTDPATSTPSTDVSTSTPISLKSTKRVARRRA